MRVRKLRPADVPRLLELIDGLADYEKLDRPRPEARARLARDAVGPGRKFRTLLAEVDGAVVGYAIYFFTYSTFRGLPTLYLEDIFVMTEHRGRGAGRALFDACRREAERLGCGRMEWTVLDWNAPAIEFYRRSGAQVLPDWRVCRLTFDPATARPSTK